MYFRYNSYGIEDFNISDHKAIVLCSSKKKFDLEPIPFNSEHTLERDLIDKS